MKTSIASRTTGLESFPLAPPSANFFWFESIGRCNILNQTDKLKQENNLLSKVISEVNQPLCPHEIEQSVVFDNLLNPSRKIN